MQFNNLSKYRDILEHRIFMRDGGVSKAPYDSLNVRFDIGDKDDDVIENRKKICMELGIKYEALFSAVQTHSKNMKVVSFLNPLSFLPVRQAQGKLQQESTDISKVPEDRASKSQKIPEDFFDKDNFHGIDAMITNEPGIYLMTQVADCQAILLFDPSKKVIANIHAGWKGQIKNITAETVRKMQIEFGCDPSGLLTAVSPSLGPCCSDFSDPYNEFPEKYHKYIMRSLDSLSLARDDSKKLSFRAKSKSERSLSFRASQNGESRNLHVDLWAITLDQLLEAGLKLENIEFANICTACNNNRFFSYRADKGKTGRFGAVIGLKI